MSPDDERHGTEAGCRQHYRAGVPVCPPCNHARMVAQKRRRLAGANVKVPSLGSQRRIQALQAIGYSRERVANELGYSDQGSLTYLMRDTTKTMLAATARRISDAYDRLSMTPLYGPGPSRARTWARRHGYPPPLAWDDIDRDERPIRLKREARRGSIDEAVVVRSLAGERMHTSQPERHEIVRRWLETGRPLAELDARAGINSARELREMNEAS